MSNKEKFRDYLRKNLHLLDKKTSEAVDEIQDAIDLDISERTYKRYFQELRKEEVGPVDPVQEVSTKAIVFDLLEDHPELVGIATKDARERIKDMAQVQNVPDSTIDRYIQKYRKKIEMDTSEDVSNEYWFRYYEDTDTYTIQAGQFQLQEVPAQEVQDWIQSYVYMGEKKSQSVVARRACIKGRPLTRKQVRKVFKALGVTKDSLPVAPHIEMGSVDDAAAKIREAQQAAIEAKIRFEEADYWKKQYIDLRKKDSVVSDMAEKIIDCIQESNPLNLPPLPINRNLDGYTGILFLSDWHVGQKFETHNGKFNKDVFQSRLLQLGRNLNYQLQIDQRPINHLHIAIGGDMVDGVLEMRNQHSLDQDLWEGEQVSHASEGLAWLIEGLHKRADCPTSVWSVGGNHDRAGGSRDNDPNRIVAQWLAQMTETRLRHYPNITWKHDKSWLNIWEVDNVMFILSHGDNTAPDGKDVVHPFRRAGIETYMVLTGHKHSPLYSENMDVTWVQSGSLVGPDDYASPKGKASRPSQIWIEIPEGSRPKTMIIPVD